MPKLSVSEWAFRLGLVACAGGVGSYVVAALQQPLGADLVRHVAWFLAAFAFYLVAVLLVLLAERHLRDGRTGRADLALILMPALLFRLALLVTTPSLSDDVFRYVWDGKLLNAGIDPYRYPPSAPELALLRDSLWEGINHKSMPTPYPPAAEALFAAAYRLLPDSPRAMQAMAVAFDLGVMALLFAMLGSLGLDRRRVLVYGWNPLVLLQFAHGAHYDAAMILPLLGALYLLGMGRRIASGMLLALATAVKLVPFLLVPLFLPLWGWTGLLGMVAVLAAGLLPWWAVGSGPAGLISEAGDARFNDSLGYLLVKLMEPLAPNPEVAARGMALVVLVLFVLLAAIQSWRRPADWKSVLRGSYALLGLFLLLNAVVEPWYLTWVVPFLCFFLRWRPSNFLSRAPAFGWLLFSGLVVLTDLSYLPGAPPSLWVAIRIVEYGPLYLLLGLTAWDAARPNK